MNNKESSFAIICFKWFNIEHIQIYKPCEQRTVNIQFIF